MNAPRCRLPLRPMRLLAAALLITASSASASTFWGGVALTSRGPAVFGGVQILPVPLVGTFGAEVEVIGSGPSGDPEYSVTAMLRDVGVPLTDISVFGGAGVTFGSDVRRTQTFLEGGARAQVVGPVGLRGALRVYGAGPVRFGFGAEVRF